MKNRLLAPVLAVAIAIAGCAGTSKPGPTASRTTPTATVPEPANKIHKLASGLIYEDLIVGNGTMADPGLTVTVHYTGWLSNGTQFQSSVEMGRPYTFQLGSNAVIAGWDQGIKGMRMGGKRKLTIPPDMAYGARGSGETIPPNATLVFEVELLGVK